MSIYSKLKWSQRVSSKIFQTNDWGKEGKDLGLNVICIDAHKMPAILAVTINKTDCF